MKIACVWEHNGNDTLLYARDLPGAYSRGESLEVARSKMKTQVNDYLRWLGESPVDLMELEIVQEVISQLNICDADSDVLLEGEDKPLSMAEYQSLKAIALKSAEAFLQLYESIPDKQKQLVPARKTFYGQIPSTGEEMYQHTKSVNAYYFGEVNVDADNEGSILDCRRRGFDALEQIPGFMENNVIEGSYGEQWSIRKLMRRFIWHDRIHAKAMYRHGCKAFGDLPNVFCF